MDCSGLVTQEREWCIFARKIAQLVREYKDRDSAWIIVGVSGRARRNLQLIMQPDFRVSLVDFCRRVLRPLIRILVRFGVSAGEFKSIVDSVYAEAGSEYLRDRGERPTYSRLAVITGINRSFLPLLLAKPKDEFRPRSDTQLHRASRVLSGWYEDPQFQTSGGRPALLFVRGRGRTFQKLAQGYSGGVYYSVVLAELLRAGAVRRSGPDRVRAVRRSLFDAGANTDFILHAGETASDLLTTLEHNLTAKPHEQLPVRSLVLRADPRSLPLFRTQVGRRAETMLEGIDAFLQGHPAEPSRNGAEHAEPSELTLGATVFAVCRRPDSAGGSAQEPARPRRSEKAARPSAAPRKRPPPARSR